MITNVGSGIEIRRGLPSDTETIEELYPAAFPKEDLLPLIRELLSEQGNVLSFVAISEEKLVGHIVFTMCRIDGRPEKVGLLGPVAVAPPIQRQGIGSALIQEGINRLKSEGATQINVLGDPAYYGRFGFKPDRHVTPPYDLPQEWKTAWQFVSLDGVTPHVGGRLSVPVPWRQPTLWAP